jgi:ribosomal protein L37E
MERNPNQGRIIKCKVCGKEAEHHAKEMCLNCYRKHGWKRDKIICKNCGKERYHKAFGLCSSCHVKLHHYDKVKAHNYRKWHNIPLELYRKITEKCILCEFDQIVELHHLDGDHKNNSETNLVGLCPNHHKMLHDERYSSDIKKELAQKLKIN